MCTPCPEIGSVTESNENAVLKHVNLMVLFSLSCYGERLQGTVDSSISGYPERINSYYRRHIDPHWELQFCITKLNCLLISLTISTAVSSYMGKCENHINSVANIYVRSQAYSDVPKYMAMQNVNLLISHHCTLMSWICQHLQQLNSDTSGVCAKRKRLIAKRCEFLNLDGAFFKL